MTRSVLTANQVTLAISLAFSAAAHAAPVADSPRPGLLAAIGAPDKPKQPEQIPLSGKPYRLAEQAYQALAAGKVDNAEALVNKALKMRPDSKQLGEMALDIQMRKGDLTGAKVRADSLLARYPKDAQLQANRGYVSQKMARHEAAVADFSAALAQEGLTAQQQRNVRLSLADSATVINRPQQALDALIPVVKPESYAVQIRVAQAHFMLEHRELARAAAESAARLASSDAEREYAQKIISGVNVVIPASVAAVKPMTKADTLLQQAYDLSAKGRDKEALAAFQQAFQANARGATAYADAGYTARRLNDNDTAVALLTKALAETPALDAAHARDVRLTLADIALLNRQPQQALDVLQAMVSADSYAVQMRVAQAELMLGHKELALAAVERADKYAETSSELAETQRQAQVIRAMLASPVASTASVAVDANLNRGYELLAAHQDEQALAAFQAGFAAGHGSAVNYADAGYAAKRLGKNDVATGLMERAIDINAASPTGSKSFTDDQVFGYEREIQEMNRSWGFSATISKQHAPPVGGRTRNNTLASGMDVYWQPYFNNGRLAQVYFSSYQTLFDYTGTNAAGVRRVPTGLVSNTSAVGVRYKPVGDFGLMLSAEKQVNSPNNITNESLVRIGYSTDNGTDIKPVAHDWSTFQFYAAATYYLASNNRYIYSAEGTFGHSFHLSAITERLVMYPHYGATYYFDSNLNANTVNNPLIGGVVPPAPRESWGYGPGVKFRYWLPEHGRYSSASVMDLNIQYHMRRGPGPNVQIGQGLLVYASFWY